MTATLPVPSDVEPTREAAPYWEAAAEGRLVLPWCRDCGAPFWYPRAFCPLCGGEDLDWRAASGRGTIYTFTIVRRARGSWGQNVPYILAYVALDDGPIVTANVVQCDPLELEVGTPVMAVFETTPEAKVAVLRFRPVDPSPEHRSDSFEHGGIGA